MTGGPKGDCGLTGRKIIVDTYGGSAPHGGGRIFRKRPVQGGSVCCLHGPFSGQAVGFPGMGQKSAWCRLPMPLAWLNRSVLWWKPLARKRIIRWIFAAELATEFDLRPRGIIETLDLLRPIYYPTAAYGHFGRDDLSLPWETVDSTEKRTVEGERLYNPGKHLRMIRSSREDGSCKGWSSKNFLKNTPAKKSPE